MKGDKMGEMAILGKEGDTKVVWDPENEDEVSAAEAQFDTLISRKFLAFKVKKNGEKGAQIKKFDPEAGMIILCPVVQGG